MIVKKSDDAVSPVIGVMLMLVVTVVIAAAVTIFATGVVGETEPAPVAVLDVKILSNVFALDGESYGEGNLRGPDLQITHLSGDAVDTKDVELRFSWTCDNDNCESDGTHYSSYSADGCKEKFPNGIEAAANRDQALYAKISMNSQRADYGSTGGVKGAWGLDHYFGDVILTPGMTLTASTEFLKSGETHTESKFMDIIFNNYKVEKKVIRGEVPDHPEETCPTCKYYIPSRGYGCNLHQAELGGYCGTCYMPGLPSRIHPPSECGPGCPCYNAVESPSIMSHLQPGTAVDVMIIHTPSNKAIYDNTVVVQ